MSNIEVCDIVGLLSEYADDALYLTQEIREEYFEAYDGKNENDVFSLANDHNRYAALFRILDSRFWEITKSLRDLNRELNKRGAVTVNA